MKNTDSRNRDRRHFLSSITSGAVAMGLASIGTAANGTAPAPQQDASSLDAWFGSMKGKHRMVFDAVTANDGFPVIWSYTFMTSNNATGTPDEDLNAVIVLRSKAIPLALEDKVWSKYKLGKMFKLTDLSTNVPADRNLYFDPKEGEMPEKGMSIKALLERGARFCVCDTALTMTSRLYAKTKDVDPLDVKKEWISGIIPGIKVVPSGVWAINRAQENGCSYCSAG
ncbi:MAG TPA: hypothetical protein VK666_20370 [Chryseolinea sp.]|nr:hypothetical protein [Chryseolinea sp.]